jgi:hypothetical protein
MIPATIPLIRTQFVRRHQELEPPRNHMGVRRFLLILLAVCGLMFGASVAAALRTAAPGSVNACARVYWRSIRNGDQRCPRSHSMLSDVSWVKLRWSSWSVAGATGRGVQVHRDAIGGGQPVRCHDQTNSIKVRLSHSRWCSDARRICARIDVVEYSHDGRRVSYRVGWSYYCTPRLPSRGLDGGGG